MRPDEHQKEDAPERNRGGGGGGKIPGGGLLTFLLPLLFKRPKLLLVAIIIFGGWYFFNKGCNNPVAGNIEASESALYKGCNMDPEEYGKAYVFAALSDKEKLPVQASLSKFCPSPRNQGQQGSCVGWGSAYAARTIMESMATGKAPNEVAFSPSYLYNQIHLPDCQGAYINKAMDVQSKNGALPFKYFQYDENSCAARPNAQMVQAARGYNIHGYNRLTSSERPDGVDLQAIKQNIAKGGPVVIGMLVGGSFMQEMMGADVWEPSKYDYGKQGFGGHCMCLVGYDDNKYGGAVQIYNSWGPEWGKNGIAWVRYEDFNHFCVEAYGIDPLASKQSGAQQNLIQAQVSLLNIKPNVKGTARYGSTVPLSGSGPTFESGIIRVDNEFKIEISNSNPCYIYVIGEESDKSTYRLFPYTDKHSAYCGITGTRVFPQDFSMFPDKVGNRDQIAIIVTKNPLDINALSVKINSQTGAFQQKIQTTLSSRFNSTAKLIGGKITFNYSANNADAAFCVIGINKK